MSSNEPEAHPAELRIKTKASEWALKKLEAEATERDSAGSEVRQIALRMPAADVAFVGAIAKRFRVSRNQALCLLVASACGDVYEALPFDERKNLLDHVAEELGHPVKPLWMRPPPWSSEAEDFMDPDEVEAAKRRARFEP